MVDQAESGLGAVGRSTLKLSTDQQHFLAALE